MGNTIVTYIYPGAEQYIPKFIESLNQNELKEINLCIFNDNANIHHSLFSSLKFSFEIINMNGTINEIRYNSFDILKSIGSDNIIFQDIDDLFSINRFSVLCQKLLDYDLVCNDLIKMSRNHIDQESYWGGRLGNNFEFDYNFIKDKNILGLGNTALKTHLLQTDTFFSNYPIAYDWFYFYQILKLNQIKALFTTDGYTHYLQHELNVAGIKKDNNHKRLEHILNVKTKHYKTLTSHGYEELESYLSQLKKNDYTFDEKEKNYFWWEELN